MNDLLPFFVPLFVVGWGLLFSVLGALGLFSTFRKGSGVSPAGEPTSDPSARVKKMVRSALQISRISGIFWFFLGVAILWSSDIRDPWMRPDSWILPSVGLFWTVLGAWEFLSSFRQRRQDAIARKASKAVEASSKLAVAKANARGSLRLACVVSICVGIAMVYFSGIRVGASPAVVSRPREDNDRLVGIVTDHVARAFDRKGHVGLVVGAIAKDGEMLSGFGARRLGDSHPPDADTVFEIGSISKVFTGILLAQRIESGDLKLDDRISGMLPGGWSLSESARGITPRHCTTHTSGFPRLPANSLSISGVLRQLFGGDPYRDYSEAKFRDALATVELGSKPGAKRDYSNFAVGLLGFALATQNGSDYETLVTSKICRPLGMQRTVISDDEWQREHMAAKYRSTFKLGPVIFALESDEWRVPNHLAGAGAIRSTGRDMMAFLKANMGLIPTPIDAAIRRSHQELFQERADRAMGMNWIRSFEGDISQDIIWHNGGTGGFRTYLGFTEDRRFGVFVLSNTSIGVDALAVGILKALVRENTPGSRRTVTKHGYAKLAPNTGVSWEKGRIKSGNAVVPLPSVQMRVQPIEDKEPETTKALRGVLVATLGGPLDPDLFTEDAQRARFPAKVEEVGKKIARIGPLVSFDLIGRKDEGGWRTHRYRALLGETALVVTFALAGDGKIGGLTVVPE